MSSTKFGLAFTLFIFVMCFFMIYVFTDCGTIEKYEVNYSTISRAVSNSNPNYISYCKSECSNVLDCKGVVVTPDNNCYLTRNYEMPMKNDKFFIKKYACKNEQDCLKGDNSISNNTYCNNGTCVLNNNDSNNYKNIDWNLLYSGIKNTVGTSIIDNTRPGDDKYMKDMNISELSQMIKNIYKNISENIDKKPNKKNDNSEDKSIPPMPSNLESMTPDDMVTLLYTLIKIMKTKQQPETIDKIYYTKVDTDYLENNVMSDMKNDEKKCDCYCRSKKKESNPKYINSGYPKYKTQLFQSHNFKSPMSKIDEIPEEYANNSFN